MCASTGIAGDGKGQGEVGQDSVKHNACLTLLVADCIALFGQHCT